MQIPTSKIPSFVADIIGACSTSRAKRIQQYAAYRNMFLIGSETESDFAIYNKTFAYIDDLDSLLYSPVSLKFMVSNYDTPTTLDQAKYRISTSNLTRHIRESNLDSTITDAVLWSLVKGKTFIKTVWGGRGLVPLLVQPEFMGVLQENHNRLDSNMEAFVHSTYITPYQFQRLIWNRSDNEKAELTRKAQVYIRPSSENEIDIQNNAVKQILVGGLYPYKEDSGSTQQQRGTVGWMSGTTPEFAPEVIQSLMRLDEAWIWDDNANDWATFQMIGNDIMITGEDFVTNALAFNPVSGRKHPDLIGKHPFSEYCPNRLDGYFWGRSEIINVALLQLAINARVSGINQILRQEEEPPAKFRGVAGVNQNIMAKLRKRGGYFSDANPQADVNFMRPEVGADLWASVQQYERMFDEMGGLPPIAKGRGESGVRSQGHAETLVRMFSPRFKDRALLVERSVEETGGLVLDLCRAHDDKKMLAWVPEADAGVEKKIEPMPGVLPPVPGTVPVEFSYADLPSDVKLSVDSHSSSPAFSMESERLAFDLFKVGAMDVTELIERMDIQDQEALIADFEKRKAQEAEFLRQHPELAAKMAKRR